MNRRIPLLWLCLGLAVSLPAAVDRMFHVAPAPAGDDAHPGDATSPFATLARARQAVRAHLAAHTLRGDVVVEIAGGTYELASPLRLEPEDSGQNGFAVVYRGAPGADVILSGGRRVTGWTQTGAGLWQAPVGSGVDFRQLWVADRRAVRARYPNAGRTLRLDTDKATDGFDLPRDLFSGVTVRPAEIEISVLIAWMHKRLRISRVADTDRADHVRAVIEPGEWDAVTHQPQGDRVYADRPYWLENAPEFLDAPGEFYLNRPQNILRYQPRPGENPVTASIVRPVLESLIILAGRLDAPVHDVRFENLTLAHTGWTRPNHHGFVDVQANSLVPADPAAAVDEQYRHNQRKDRVPAAFQAFTADRIVVRGCRFARLGGTGLLFTHGGDDNVIEGNSFFDVSAGGIELGEDAARPTDPRRFPRRNRIANNFLAHIGEEFYGSVAILGYYTDGSLITHNEIAAIPYTGVSQGWGWGTPPAPADSRDNRITHNLVTNYMRRLDDGGGLYTTDGLVGSEIAHNVVERMLPPDPHTKAGGALYLDQFTAGVHVHHNLVTDTVRWLFIWNPNIRDNRVDANYADTPAQRNDGTDNLVEPVRLLTNEAHAESARAIRAAAGLEPAFTRTREYAGPTDVIIDSTGVDFQPVKGPWTPTAPAGRYGSHVQQASDPDAAARWSPVLPRTGDYALSVWRPAGSPAAAYTIRYPGGESTVPLPAGGDSGWEHLGDYVLPAGTGVDVLVQSVSPAGRPLVLDAIRFTPIPR